MTELQGRLHTEVLGQRQILNERILLEGLGDLLDTLPSWGSKRGVPTVEKRTIFC
jgi:hypothetical protein